MDEIHGPESMWKMRTSSPLSQSPKETAIVTKKMSSIFRVGKAARVYAAFSVCSPKLDVNVTTSQINAFELLIRINKAMRFEHTLVDFSITSPEKRTGSTVSLCAIATFFFQRHSSEPTYTFHCLYCRFAFCCLGRVMGVSAERDSA